MAPGNVLITGAGSGFGLYAAATLAAAGYVVYGGLQFSEQAAAVKEKSERIRTVVLDITNQDSINDAVKKIESEVGGLDCLVHNAGHMCMGPAEAFSAESFHEYFDINVVGAHRLNQAVLPSMRKTRRGHIVWVSSSSARGGSGPLLAPYFAAKAAMHSLALSLSTEIACWGIETTIIVPGIFPLGTSHFKTAGKPDLQNVATEYMDGPLKGADTIKANRVMEAFPKDASPQLVADAIFKAVGAPRGSKPFRISVDPFQDGSDEIMSLADEKHKEFLRRCGLVEICKFRE